MTGISFYYYFTHDETVLKKILKLKDYNFENYYHPGKDVFTWLPNKNQGKGQSVELVAHLDQLYAYMLWLAPSLPQPYKEEYLNDMKKIVNIMIERFYSEVYGTFWGASNSPDMKVLGNAHTDFGHSIKAMWVIYQTGVWTDEIYFMNFARQKMHSILERAFDPGNGSWNRRILPDGSVDQDKEWWSLAELDQAASLLALKDPTYLQYLNRTYDFWFKNMVDHKNGEIWHALFCYLTSKELLDQSFTLYYAFESIDEVVHQTVTPYLFKANITNVKTMRKYGEEELIHDGEVDRLNIAVTFNSLH